MRLLRNPKGSLYLVAAFVILLLVLFARHSRASELQLEGGAAVLRGSTPALGLSIQWPDHGPIGTDYELGFMLIGDGTHDGKDFGNQVAWYGMLWDGWKAVELGIGAAYFNVPSPFTCQTTFALGARWRISKRFSTQWRHFSSGGSCQPNSGRDLATLSYRF